MATKNTNLKEEIKLLEKIQKIREDVAEAAKEQAAAEQEAFLKLGEQLTSAEKYVAAREAQISDLSKEIDIYNDLIKAGRDELDILIEAKKTQKGLAIADQARLDYLLKHLAEDQKLRDLQLDIYKTTINQLKVERDAAKQAKKTREETKQSMDAIAGTVGGLLGISAQWEDSIIGSFIKARTEGQSFATTLTDLNESMQEQFSVANLLGSTIQKLNQSMIALAAATAKFALEQDEAVASVRQGVVGSKIFDDTLVDVHLSTRTLGVSVAEAAEAVVALEENMAAFSVLSKSAREEIAKSVILLKELGVSLTTSAKLMQTLNKSLGMTTEQSTDTILQMAAAAEAINMPIQEMFEGFQQSMPVLAKYGTRAVEVFKQMAATAKATGIAVGDLMSITSQYDTFEGAAQAAGRLNAILGGTLNAVDLLNASEAERARLLVENFQATGKSWESLGRFEKQAIASAAGISDMDQAAKLFTQDLAELDKTTSMTEEAAFRQEEFEEAIRNTMTVVEKIETLLQSFLMSLRPVIDAFGEMLDFILKLRKEYETGFNVVMYTLLGIMTALAIAIGTVVAAYILLNIVASIATGAQALMGITAGVAAPVLDAMGLSADFAATGVAALGAASTAALPAIAGVAASLALVLIPLAAMALVLPATLLAIAAIGAEFVALIAILAMFPNVIVNLAKSLYVLTPAIIDFTIGMAKIAPISLPAALAMVVLGSSAAVLGVGLIYLASSMLLFSLALKDLDKGLEKLPIWTTYMKSFLFEIVKMQDLIVGAVVPLTMLGAALLPLGVGVLSLALGLEKLSGLSGEVDQIADVLFRLIGIALQLAPAMVLLAIPINLIGIALIPFGLGLALVGVGIMAVGKGLELIKESIGWELIGQLSVLLITLGALGTIGGVLSPFLISFGFALGIMSVGLLLLGTALGSIGDALKSIGSDASTVFASVASGIAKLMATLDEVSPTSVLKLMYISEPLEDLAVATAKLTPEATAYTRELVDQAARYTQVSAESKAAPFGNMVQAVASIGSSIGNAGGGGGAVPQEVVLMLDKRELARTIKTILNEENDLAIR